MSWFLLVLFLSLTLGSFSDGRHEKKLPSAIIVGAVYCDTCFQQDFSKKTHFIPGATIAVECKLEGSSVPKFREEMETDENGEFRVHLPLSVSKHLGRIKACSVQLISSNQPYCSVASTATSVPPWLKSRRQGEHIFSAGFFSFKPQNQPNLCNQKPSPQKFKQPNSVKPFLLSSNKQAIPFLSNYQESAETVGQSNKNEVIAEEASPLNPFPPALPFPNPFQHPPFFPNPFQPPPSPSIPLPPLLGLTPSPPPPSFPFHLPPFPFPPLPRFPGIPPAQTANENSP